MNDDDLDDDLAELDALCGDTLLDDPKQSYDDAVEAMQELLVAHADTGIHRVEDPDLARALNEVRALATSNIADVLQSQSVLEYIGVDDSGEDEYRETFRINAKDVTALPREISACIQSVKIKRLPGGDTVEVKMYDKLIALDKLLRFHGAYQADNDQRAKANEGVMDLLFSTIAASGLPSLTDNSA